MRSNYIFKACQSVFLLLIPAFMSAQTPTLDWVFRAGGSGGNEDAFGIDTDGKKGAIVCGSYQSTTDFNPGPGVNQFTYAGDNRNVFVARYDSNGVFKWVFKVAGLVDDYAFDVKTDTIGSIYVTGTFGGTNVDFNPGAAVYSMSTSANYEEMFLAKYDTSKNFHWAIHAQGVGSSSMGRDILFESTGNIIVHGQFSDTADFDPSAATANLISVGVDNTFIAKYDTAGHYLSAFSLPVAYGDITIDDDDNIYITGSFTGTVDFDPSAGIYNLTAPASTYAFIAKYDQAGNFLWAISLPSSTYSEGFGVQFGNNNLYIIGRFSGTMDADVGSGTYNLTTLLNATDAFVLKYDLSGNFVWAFDLDGAYMYEPGQIEWDPNNGGIIISGGFVGTRDFDPSASVFNMTASSSYNDLYFAAYMEDKSLRWAYKIGGNKMMYSEDMRIIESGELYISGSFSGTSDFNPATAVNNLTSATSGSSFDLYVGMFETSFQPLALSVSGTNGVCGNPNGTATASATGASGTYSYLWSPSAQTTATATGLSPGIYTVTVTDANTSALTATISIGNSAGPSAGIASQQNVTCHGNADGSALIMVSGGTSPYTYSWNDPLLQSTAAAVNLPAGTYSVTVRDANNCATTIPITITEPPLLSSSVTSFSGNTSCTSSCNGSATVSVNGGAIPYTYQWNDPFHQSTATATGLCAGTYSVYISDNNGCVQSATVAIAAASSLNTSVTGTTSGCQAACNGTATVSVSNGAAPFSYQWNDPSVQTTAVANGLCAGTYTVNVMDNNGCAGSSVLTINALTPINASMVGADVTCYAACDGSATVSVTNGTAPYSYQWNDPASQTTAAANGLCSGSYLVIVTDANGCVGSGTLTVNEPPELSITISSTMESCGSSNGTASVMISGGVLPYSYEWDDPALQTTPTATGLVSGNYLATVADANGCIDMDSIFVDETDSIVASFVATDELLGNDGSIDLSVSGGTSPYSYNWTGPNGYTSSVEDLNGLEAGVYDVTITDTMGCSSILQVLVGSQVSIKEFSKLGFKVYPNPSKGVITVSTEMSEEYDLCIYNMLGQKIIPDQNNVKGQVKLDISANPDGVYYLHLKTQYRSAIFQLSLIK